MMKIAHKKIVIIGATSTIAEHCARLWANHIQGEIVLVGRNQEKLQRVQADLQVRSPSVAISTVVGAFEHADTIKPLVDDIWRTAPVDLVLIAHGILPDQDKAQTDLHYNAQTLTINAISPVLLAEAFAAHMEMRGHGQIGVIGSVAGDRGRKSNYAYGAAKGLIERYVEGMQHRFFNTKVQITLIKPGPTRTPMTAALAGSERSFAAPDAVARRIVHGMARHQPVMYAPAKWRFIMTIIRHLPRFIFNRMDI